MHFAVPRNHRTVALWLVAALCAAAPGCGEGLQTADPVDADRARETLRTVLETWKNGDAPESLKERSPSIVVQDMDWIGGTRLLNYEIVDSGRAVDANLLCKVKLTLSGPQNRATSKTVTYIVGTSPVLTVFREVF